MLIVVLLTINTVADEAERARPASRPASALPPFAVPLALGDAERRRQRRHPRRRGRGGQRARRARCAARGILNICELYEQGPVVLALFVDAGSCPAVLSDMQALAPSFPGVRFAAVAIKGERARSCAR